MAVKGNLSPVVQSTLAEPLGKLYPVGNGTTHYATHSAFVPVSNQWGYKVVAKPSNAGSGVAQTIMGGAATDWRINTVGGYSLFFLDGTSTNQFINVGSATDGEKVTLEAHFYPGRVDAYINGTLGGTSALAQHATTKSVSAFWAAPTGTQIFAGTEYYGVEFDRTPLQGARFLPGNGTNRYIAIPEITLSGDFEIEWWMVRKDGTAGNSAVILMSDDSAANNRLQINDSLNGTVPDNFVFRAGSADQSVFSAAYAGIAQNQHCHSRLKRVSGGLEFFVDGVSKGTATDSDALTLSRFWNGDGLSYFNSSMSGIVIRDLTNGNTWEYNNRNDSGNVVLNSSRTAVGVAGEERFGSGLAGYAPQSSSSIVTWDNGRVKAEKIGSASTWMARKPSGIFQMEAGTLYKAYAKVSAASTNAGATEARLILWDVGGASVLAGGAKTESQAEAGIAFLAPSTGGIDFILAEGPGAVNGDVFYMDDLVLEKVESIGTAEGATTEISTDAAGWSDFGGGSNFSNIGGALAVNTKSTSVSRATKTLSGLTVGDVLRLRMTIARGDNTGTLSVRVAADPLISSPIVSRDFATPANPGEVEFLFPVTNASMYIGVQSSGHAANQTYQLSEVSTQQTGHGIAYEGSTPMTDAAADTARSFLPMISQEYIFDEKGRIREVRAGKADATLQGGLSATDWAPE